jgi:hypothetical protein
MRFVSFFEFAPAQQTNVPSHRQLNLLPATGALSPMQGDVRKKISS